MSYYLGIDMGGTVIKAALFDDNGNELKINQRGNLWVKGPSVMKGYYKNKELTEKVLDKDNFPESEFEEKKEKKINKKFLKMKEELNTMIANLDTFVDEGAVDFENEKLIGSKDIGEITNNKNLFS